MKGLIILLLLCSVFGVSSKAILNHWKDEIDESVKRNIKFCPFKYVDQYNQNLTMSQDSFLIKRIVPSRGEMRSFMESPITLTKSHKDLVTTADQRGYNYEKWVRPKTAARWEIPQYHPAQNHANCVNLTKLVSDGRIYNFYEEFKKVDRAFYISIIQNGFIHPSGAVMASCGYFQGEEACENRWDYAREWYDNCRNGLKQSSISWESLFNANEQQPQHADQKKIADLLSNACTDKRDLGVPGPNHKNGKWNVKRVDKVFVIPALWDYNYHHFIADSLGRLVRHYDFLKKHTDIQIHIRSFEFYDGMHYGDSAFYQSSKKMRNSVFELLGLNTSRLVTGPVLAKEVYIPRVLRCAYALSNPMEMRLLARHLFLATKSFMATNYPSLIQFMNSAGSTNPVASGGGGGGGLNKPMKSKAAKKATGAERGKERNRTRRRTLEESSAGMAAAATATTPVTTAATPTTGGSVEITRGAAVPVIPPLGVYPHNFLRSVPQSFLDSSSYFWPEKLLQQFPMIRNNSLEKDKNMIIMQRHSHMITDRFWDDEIFIKVILSFAQAYPDHNIIPMSSKRLSNPNYCLACDIFLLSQADILVGAHGAGLTNMMFLPANSLIVELVGETKDVNMPVCGYYGPFAAIFGHHHYIYAFLFDKGWPLLSQQAADESSAFYQFLRKRTNYIQASDMFIVKITNSTGGSPYRP
jgi:hypothetical protein